MNEGNRAITIVPAHLRGSKVIGSRLHVDARDVESITPADARALATALRAAANDCERLDAAAVPLLDQFVATVEDHLSPAALLGIET
jgi:hypothetical protein